MRKTPKEILNVGNDERHAWLSEATSDELYEFLRWVKADSSWALHGRDALNLVLAKENIRLQKDIRDMTEKLQSMTKWVIVLTVFIAFLTFIQAYPIVKTFFNNTSASLNTPRTESTANQVTKTNQMENKKNQILNHK